MGSCPMYLAYWVPVGTRDGHWHQFIPGAFLELFVSFSRVGLNNLTNARMPIAATAIMRANQLPLAATAPAAAHTMEENASANVAMRDDVWRRRKWLRLAWDRNHNWIITEETADAAIPKAAMIACAGENSARQITKGQNTTRMHSMTVSALACRMREGSRGAVSTKSFASSPEIVSHAKPPASWPAAIMRIGTRMTATRPDNEKLFASRNAGGMR